MASNLCPEGFAVVKEFHHRSPGYMSHSSIGLSAVITSSELMSHGKPIWEKKARLQGSETVGFLLNS